MPLVKRAVEPVFVSRATLSSKVKNELEGVVVNTLARLIKQLSSVSKHAENLFGDLVNEANGIYLRTVALSGRVQGLQDRIVTLDSGGKADDKRIEDFNVKVFKSSDKEEQQILDRGTLPTALQEVYRSCSAPPALNQLTPYRDDNKDGLKFYTDPSYFFVLWVKEQTKQIEKRQKKKAKGDLKKKESKKHEVKPVERKNYPGVDKEFMEHTLTKDVPGDIIPGTPPTNRASKESYAQDHPPSGPPPPQPLSQAQLAAPTAPPPPPPPPPNPGFAPAPPPPPIQMEGGPPMGNYPSNYSPPPVPPAPGNFSAPPPPAPSAGPPPPPPPTMPSEPGVVGEIKRPPPEVDQRSPLLLAIEKGMHLRKVEKKETKPSSTYATDVASILKRRIAFEVSDAESEEEDSDWLN